MIDLAATPPASPKAGAGVPNAAATATGRGNAGHSASFAQLIPADSQGSAAASGTTDKAVLALPEADAKAQARQVLAALPDTAAATGNILPETAVGAERAPDAQPGPAGQPAAVLPLLRALHPLEARPAAPATVKPSHSASEQAVSADGDTSEATAPTAIAALAALPFGAPASEPAAPATSPAVATGNGASPAVLQPGLATPVLTPPTAGTNLLAPAALPRQAGAEQAQERTLHIPAAATSAAAAAPQFTLASPAAPIAAEGLRLRPVVERAAKTAVATQSSDGAVAPLADTLGASQPGATAAPLAHAAQAPTIGHSFAAVVDRLMAAREAAGSHASGPVAVNLHHAEFGDVSIRFDQRADGLSVALASPDPDFARAVEAAAPQGGSTGASGNGTGNGPSGNGFAWGRPTGAEAQAQHGQSGQRGNPATASERSATSRTDGHPGPAADEAGNSRPRGIYA